MSRDMSVYFRNLPNTHFDITPNGQILKSTKAKRNANKNNKVFL